MASVQVLTVLKVVGSEREQIDHLDWPVNTESMVKTDFVFFYLILPPDLSSSTQTQTEYTIRGLLLANNNSKLRLNGIA